MPWLEAASRYKPPFFACSNYHLPYLFSAIWRGFLLVQPPSAGSSRSHPYSVQGGIAGAIDQHTSKVGLLNLARYEG
jgi:hypothetical protein